MLHTLRDRPFTLLRFNWGDRLAGSAIAALIGCVPFDNPHRQPNFHLGNAPCQTVNALPILYGYTIAEHLSLHNTMSDR